MDRLIYLHGFNSSPCSQKAVLVEEFTRQFGDITLLQPQLATTPARAWQQLQQLLAPYQGDRLGFIGSSLGGFFATLLKEQYGGKAVLVNPAVNPHLLFEQFLGPQIQPYTGEHYRLDASHVRELEVLNVTQLETPQDYWLLLQQGDEVLDYRQALVAYSECRLTVEPHGDHSFLDFSRYLNAMVEFLFPVD